MWVRKTLFTAVCSLVLIYILGIGLLFCLQRQIVFPFIRYWMQPGSVTVSDTRFQEFKIKTEDGLELIGRYVPASTKPYTIIYFHGNGDDIARAVSVGQLFVAQGYGFLATDYRGYSGLPGSPTENLLYSDARSFIHAFEASGVDQSHMVLFGFSLGTGVAVQMATEFHPAGLMLQAPYLSVPKVGQLHYRFLPVELLCLDRFENYKKMGDIHVPVLIGQGEMDRVIPFAQGQELYALANEPKQFRGFPNHGHNDLSPEFAAASMDWLASVP